MKAVTIVNKQKDPDKYALSRDVEVLHEGRKIHGIVAMDVRYRVDKHVEARVELLGPHVEAQAAYARFKMLHPYTGEYLDVKRIEFTDGTSVDLSDEDSDAGAKELLFDLAMMMPDREREKFNHATDRAWFNLKGRVR